MILGIGCDIVNNNRIAKLYLRFGERFANRILTHNEKSILLSTSYDKKVPYLSKKFAAKEAISKAMGTGIGSTISFRDIEISKNSLGKPVVQILKSDYRDIIHLSISDEYPYSIAYAVIEKLDFIAIAKAV